MVTKMVKKEKINLRETTVININKEDLAPFNELRAKETGRKGKTVSQAGFVRFLTALYRQAGTEQKDAAWEGIEKKDRS